MSSRIRRRSLSFDHAALGVLITSVIVLYGLVLGEMTIGQAPPAAPESGVAVDPAPLPPAARPGPGVLPAAPRAAPWRVGRADSVGDLVKLYQSVDFRLDDAGVGDPLVPRIRVDAFPADLHVIGTAAERKRVFIKVILPLVLNVNEAIMADRRRLLALRDELERTNAIGDRRDRAWLDGLLGRVDLDALDIDALLRGIDVIPPSLALAQAAEESGWGSSRFVREGNAVFGQRTFVAGQGVVPLRRDAGKTHEVKSFSKLLDSVAAYMVNLNTHSAYREFRLARERWRATHGRLDGYALAGTLKRYSERGKAYIRTIRSIIRTNGLRVFDGARLGDGETAKFEPKV